MLAFFGLLGLLLGFMGAVLAFLGLAAGHAVSVRNPGSDMAPLFIWSGRVASLLSLVGLTVAVGILAFCFLTGDCSIQYVLENRSTSSSDFGWLYRLSGIWAGREGSLLFWAWLISLFGLAVHVRKSADMEALDNLALAVLCAVLASFAGVLLFSPDNMPFIATDEKYFDYSTWTVTVSGSVLGMNSLLEHWAMAVHPPTLFVGYAGLTVPFAYGIAALVCHDSSDGWTRRAAPFALISWVALTIGIGLGAIWAYVVLGWGGYWGWDPVENASLLPWLVTAALIHSFGVFRRKGIMGGWCVMCACIAFSAVITGTFISRSGLVQSVHAFEGDPVSLVLFLVLMIAPLVLGAGGLLLRSASKRPVSDGAAAAVGASGGDGGSAEAGDSDGICPGGNAAALAASDSDGDLESLLSREGTCYLNSVILLAVTGVVAYMTICSALPSFLPLGGQAVSAGTYEAMFRPLSILYLALVAAGPFLSWGSFDLGKTAKRLRVPAVLSLALFAASLAMFFSGLLPAYERAMAAGGTTAEAYLEQGPAWYYNGLAVVGLAVASLLVSCGVVMTMRSLRKAARNLSSLGGAVSHMALGIVLAGLIGSSMYVTEVRTYLPYDGDADVASEDLIIDRYRLEYTSNSVTAKENSNIVYQVEFDVYRDDALVGHVAPSVTLVASTQQQQLNASVLSFPDEDLFVVYRGIGLDGASLSMDVRVNPLVSFVWVGTGVLVLGLLLSFAGSLRKGRRE